MDLFLIAATSTDPTLWESILSYAWIIFSVGAGLGFVIFVHELGHFLVAKACGVKCEKFYVGFDWFPIKKIGPFTIPHSLFKKQWGETVYGIGILPLGGYVKMLGQDDDPRNAEAEAERSKVLKEGTAAEGLTPGGTAEKEYVLDPRSYQAKSVPARMAIISAGVIMNLIFGVLLAALAYGMGVPETPAIIGGTSPGSPAWEKLTPGMRAVRFGEKGSTYEYHRFEDIRRRVVFAGADKEMKVLFRDLDGSEKLYSLKPSGRALKEADFPSLGFYNPTGRKLGVSKQSPVEGVESGDILIALDGVELERDPEEFDSRVNAILAKNPSGTLKITVERAEKSEDGTVKEDAPKKRIDLVIPRRGKKTIGAFMKIGPVVAFRENSPAAKAGMQVGDVIEQIDGKPVGDPLSLSQRFAPKSPSDPPYSVTVSRKQGSKTVTQVLQVEAVPPEQYVFDNFTYGGPTAIESMGVAFEVTNEVAGVEPGTPAAKEGFLPGDVVKAVRFVAANPEARKKECKAMGESKMFGWVEGAPFRKLFDKGSPLDDTTWGWTRVHYHLQGLADPKTQIELTLDRKGKEVVATLLPVESRTFFEEDRGLIFRPLEVNHQAEGVGEAFSLGFREVKERLGDVLMTLVKLVSGGISPKHLSGPAGIIEAAGYSAGHSIAMLLMFLVMLSANLAIINFLPIPVLDGGHMLFLAAEGIRRKPVPPHIQGWLSLGGLAFLLSLMLFATAMDFQRWFE